MSEVSKDGITNIGFLSLPKFLDDLLEVQLVVERYLNHSDTIVNSGNIDWKIMIKQTFKHIENCEKERAKEPGVSDLYLSDRYETFEISLFDAKNRLEKKLQALKRVRKVYAKEPIIIKVFVKNPLMADVEVSKIFLT